MNWMDGRMSLGHRDTLSRNHKEYPWGSKEHNLICEFGCRSDASKDTIYYNNIKLFKKYHNEMNDKKLPKSLKQIFNKQLKYNYKLKERMMLEDRNMEYVKYSLKYVYSPDIYRKKWMKRTNIINNFFKKKLYDKYMNVIGSLLLCHDLEKLIMSYINI